MSPFSQQYLIAEVLELSGDAAVNLGRKRINPRHIMMCVKTDEELSELIKNAIIPGSGVMPFIHGCLLPKKILVASPQPKKAPIVNNNVNVGSSTSSSSSDEDSGDASG